MTNRIPAKPITIRGETYPSIGAAARALGVSKSAIQSARSRGSLETVGLGQRGIPAPVRIRGVLYPTIAEAARTLGVDRTTIRGALDRGTVDRVGLGGASCR